MKAANTGPARAALLLVDFINPMDFAGAKSLAPRALAAAAAARLKARLKHARVPVIYANDNFGDWRADFTMIVERVGTGCRRHASWWQRSLRAPMTCRYSSRGTPLSSARRSSFCSTSFASPS